MAKVDVRLDAEACKVAIARAERITSALQKAVDSVTSNANIMSSGYRTARYYDRERHELKGDKQPLFAGNVRDMGKGPIGIVYTGNYAAMKHNHEYNTLLKSAHK